MSFNDCLLREYAQEHFAKTVEWLNSPDIKELFGITYEVTLESHSNWISNSPSLEIIALYFKNEYIGNIVLDYNRRHSSVCLQIYIGSQEHRGAGLGAGFMKKALDHIFKLRNQNRVWLLVRQYNVPAKKLYTSLGFQTEGIERESIWTGKEFINQEKMSLLKKDWK